MKWIIKLVGCDDTTEFEMDLDDESRGVLSEVGQRSEEVSEYACCPILVVHPPGEAPKN